MRDPQAAADALVDAATHAGGSDDVTVVVVDAAAIRPPVRSQMYRTSRRVDRTI